LQHFHGTAGDQAPRCGSDGLHPFSPVFATERSRHLGWTESRSRWRAVGLLGQSLFDVVVDAAKLLTPALL
jgi:hypothetical protein